MKNQFEKWKDWFDTIYTEINYLTRYNEVYWEVQKIIKNNPNINSPNPFFEFLYYSYPSFMAMGIRRQVKIYKNKKNISFAKLLDEISNYPEIITKELCISHYNFISNNHPALDEFFDKYLKKCNNKVDAKLVKKDLEDLKEKARLCEDYADKVIAHIDKRQPKNIKFRDVIDTIEFLEELLVRLIHKF